MAEKNEKHGKEKSVLARTATYTSKKARRTTAKVINLLNIPSIDVYYAHYYDIETIY